MSAEVFCELWAVDALHNNICRIDNINHLLAAHTHTVAQQRCQSGIAECGVHTHRGRWALCGSPARAAHPLEETCAVGRENEGVVLQGLTHTVPSPPLVCVCVLCVHSQHSQCHSDRCCALCVCVCAAGLTYTYNGTATEVEAVCPADVVLLHGTVPRPTHTMPSPPSVGTQHSYPTDS